ncbi:MAG TPA: hypothetical protein VFJ05_01330 [Nitrososphaeraceae archaeon]|nr:hypothetical protein [Nitrososphaeraceae archaeon]
MDVNIANTWADLLENIADKYIEYKSGFYLASQNLDGQWHIDVAIPYKQYPDSKKELDNFSSFNSDLFILSISSV